MKNILKVGLFLLGLGFFANVFAFEDHDFVAAVVNRSGHVIKFYSGNTNIAVAMTSGSAVHLLWDASPTIPLHIAGFSMTDGYIWICPKTQFVAAGQTISVFSNNQATKESDFRCQTEPPIH